MELIRNTEEGRKEFVAAGSVIGAILASSCCIVPFLLLSLGVSGAWIGNFTALAPYQRYFTAITLGFLTAGFWYVYWKPKKACDEDSYCATPASDKMVKAALWVATALIGFALGVSLILPNFI